MTTARRTFALLKEAVSRHELDPSDLMGFEGDVLAALSAHDKGSEVGEGKIPELMVMTLARYRERRPVQISGTMRLILEGDLGAITSADSQTFGSIKTIYRWCHMELPSQSWGSREKVAAWTKGSRN